MDYVEIIVSKDENIYSGIQPDIIQPVNEKYEIWYLNREKAPALSIQNYSYSLIPKCLVTLSSDALLDSGVLRLQNMTTLSLKGQGVFIAIIDTGIQIMDDYNIFSIWDQTGNENPPEGFWYGTEYRGEQIKQADEQDEDGHGTFLASVTAGRESPYNDFVGAAPEAELIVVKLRQASEALKEYYYIPTERSTYSEADIMLGISYADMIARKENRPLVVCLALGCNNGLHVGSGALSDYISSVASTVHRAVVVASGNEANQRKHFRGNTNQILMPQRIEMDVTENIKGFYAELWGLVPEQFAVAVQSPMGSVRPQTTPVLGDSNAYEFALDNSRVTIDYRNVGRRRRDQLISVRIDNPSRGIWTLMVYPQNNILGDFDVWLPMKELLYADVYFIKSDPDTTFTMPSDSQVAMTVGGYNQISDAIYIDSGRGFEPDGWIKPDFLAPAVEIQGQGIRGQYIYQTGTSGAVAIAAGACAQLLEWAVVRENAIGINSVDIKNLLIRGARRRDDIIYPSKQYGYGIMDVYQSFRLI